MTACHHSVALLRFAVFLFALIGTALYPAAAQARYTVTDLGTLGGPWSDAWGINNSGQVVGTASLSDGRCHAFLWQKGLMKDLGTFGGRLSRAFAINDKGQVVGTADVNDTYAKAFLWEKGAMRDLIPWRIIEVAQAINNKGDVLISYYSPWAAFIFLYSGGVLTDLYAHGLYEARGINDAVQIVGRNTAAEAVLYKDGTIVLLGALPGGVYSAPIAINNSGQVVGISRTADDKWHAFRFNVDLSGKVTSRRDLGTLYGRTSQANAINNGGDVVGTLFDVAMGQPKEAFVCSDKGTLPNLNTLIPSSSGWKLVEAKGINDHGQIVGYGKHSGKTHAFLLTPLEIRLPNSVLTLTDNPDDPKRTVVGIVCDNLRGMPEDLEDKLTIKLAAKYASATAIGIVTTSDGKTTDSDGKNNVGTVEGGKGKLTYFPPDEFNERQEPTGIGQITTKATRSVWLTVRFTADGKYYVVGPKEIVLARPPVVLVHGINSDPGVWYGEPDKGKVGLLPALNSFGFYVRWVNHNTPDDLTDADYYRKRALRFRGNGPVEYVASLLGKKISDTLDSVRSKGFAARRADIVAHSYGGVITRWYLRTDTKTSTGSQSWYTNSWNVRTSSGDDANLYWIKDFTETADYKAQQNVRKVITLASMWRGIPLCNYLNETRGPAPAPDLNLYNAPFLLISSLGAFIDGDFFHKYGIPTRVPSMEVMAVNSRWLSYLDWFTEPSTGKPEPFLDTVAYGFVAGDDKRE